MLASSAIGCEQRNEQIFASKELKSELWKCFIYDKKSTP